VCITDATPVDTTFTVAIAPNGGGVDGRIVVWVGGNINYVGRAQGDVHNSTFDELHYDFQGVGEYVDAVADAGKGELPLPPGRKVAVLACMDARLDPARALGLDDGDAHVIRNAGGVVSEDALRSLVISQRLLGTEEVILIHHTDCGMLTFSDDEVKASIQADTGLRPHFALEAFPDLEDDVRQSIARIKASPFVPRKDNVRGFVYDVKTGRLDEVV
jgi:carbonic anhydrase